jgi:hypothetical protein
LLDTAAGRAKPDYDGDEVLHSCNLCSCPFIKEVVLQLNTDHIYFEQLKQGIGAMFANFKKTKLPGWKVPKTKTMVLADKKRDVKKGQFEVHFKNPKPVNRGRGIPEWANITRGGNRVVQMEMPRNRCGSF